MKSDFKQILNDLGLKITPQRTSVLEVLSDLKKPITIQEIFLHLKKKNIDLVTIYRTITSLEKVGLVKRVDLRQDAVFYELNMNHHHHIVCTNCGTMEDFEICEMEKLSKKIASKSHKFKTIVEHNFELFGLCNSCST
jgi:Fur family peroxide stress response transcriptional regulator